MKLKQTRKKIILSAFVVVFLGAVGFFANKLFINNNKTNAAGGSIAISYDTTGVGVSPLGDPSAEDNKILKKWDQEFFESLKSWSDVGDTRTEKNERIQFSTNSKWNEGLRSWTYGSQHEMRPVRYVEVPGGNETQDWKNEDLTWTVTTKEGYEVEVQIMKVLNTGPANTYLPFIISETGNYVSTHAIYDAKCTAIKAGDTWPYYNPNNNSPEENWIKCNDTWNIGDTVTDVNGHQRTITADDDMFPTKDVDNTTHVYRRNPADSNGNMVNDPDAKLFVTLRYTVKRAPSSFYMKIDDIGEAQSYRFENTNTCRTNGECDIYVKPNDYEKEPGKNSSKFRYNFKSEESGYDYDSNYQDNYIYYDSENISIFSSYQTGFKVSYIFDTYQGLQAFNTSSLKNGDIVKVRTDSAHGDDTAYYRYDKTLDTFIYYDAELENPDGPQQAREIVDNPDTANIYIKFNQSEMHTLCGGDDLCAAENGNDPFVEFTYGFGGGALSRWEFLTQSFDVKWKAVKVNDEGQTETQTANDVFNHHGEQDEEDADAVKNSIYEGETIGIGNIPTLKDSAQYVITHWTVDKDITGTNITTQTEIDSGAMANIARSIGITADYTFTAHLAVREYNVTWRNYNNNILRTDNVAYDVVPSYNSTDPTKPADATCSSYLFTGWNDGLTTYPKDSALPAVTQDVTYTAQYQCLRTVVWKNHNGAILETDNNLKEGDMPEYNNGNIQNRTKAADTTCSEYEFDKWLPSLTPVKTTDGSTITYTASFKCKTTRTYTVTWKNYDTVAPLRIDYSVTYNTVPSYGSSDPIYSDGGDHTFDFIGWTDEDTGITYPKESALPNVTKNVTYVANYRKTGVEHVVKYYENTSTTPRLLATEIYNNNEIITSIPETVAKEPTEQYTYTPTSFTPMDNNTPNLVLGTTKVTGDYNYVVTFTPAIRKYKITFVDDDDKPIDEILLEYGQTPSHDKAPDKKVDNCAYTFSKWTPEFAVVTGPATYKATYTKECVEDVPNTGLGETLGGANGNNTTIIIAIAGIFAATSAATAYRFYRRRRIMKF